MPSDRIDIVLQPYLLLIAMVTGGQRFRIFDRDDYRCLACGRSPEGDDVVLHVDHIIPRSKGGSDGDDNLQTLCAECNLGKGNRSDRDLRRQRPPSTPNK